MVTPARPAHHQGAGPPVAGSLSGSLGETLGDGQVGSIRTDPRPGLIVHNASDSYAAPSQVSVPDATATVFARPYASRIVVPWVSPSRR